jgi:aminoglycoside 2'-N-acetyltransferase I
MSIEIDVLNGDASWPRVKPLMDAVWPDHVMAELSWKDVKWAHADLRVLIDAPEEEVKPGLACHAGIYFRTAIWNGRKISIGGIGGVATREDCRGRGYAGIALGAAVQTLRQHEAVRFALLFCEPHILRSTRPAAGIPSPARSMPSSLRGGFASRRWRRSCSTSPERRATAPSTYAACHGDPCAAVTGLRPRGSIICWP